MVLAAMEHFDLDEFPRFLRALISWMVRGLIAGGVVEGGVAENAFAEAATKITSRQLTKTEEVLGELEGIVASDRQLVDELRTARVNRTRLARYYLISLMRATDGDQDAALVTDAVEDEWSLHLALPRRAQPNQWAGFPDDAIGQLANRLGNQFILSRDSELPDDPVERGLAIAAEGSPGSVDAQEWSADAVAERQAKLAELAPLAWPLLP
jgi:rRNA-processing protein FCF1